MKLLTEMQLTQGSLAVDMFNSVEIKGLQEGIFAILNSFLTFIPFSCDNALMFFKIFNNDISMNVCEFFSSKQFSAFQSSLFKKKIPNMSKFWHTISIDY